MRDIWVLSRLGVAALSLFLSACIVGTGPKIGPTESASGAPVLRLGSVQEQLTGSWQRDGIEEFFGAPLRAALQESGPDSLFSSDPASLTLDLQLTSQHASDGPRLVSLGLFSILTLGVIPAYYSSEWDVQCDATIVSGDGVKVAEYHVHESGTYKILALPPTMFTLLGAGIRGDADARSMAQKTARGLAAKLTRAVDRDYPRLARLREANVPSLEALGGGRNALLARGRAHLDAGRVEKARDDMLRYAERDVRLLGALDASTAIDFYDSERRRSVADSALSQARSAERSAAWSEAFRSYQLAYAWSPGGDAEIEQLRQSLVRLFGQIEHKPELPEAARRFFVEGEALAKADDFNGAAVSFEKVTHVAPWFPFGHFNLALVQARADRYSPAIRSMETFLKLAPDSSNARLARDRVYEWKGRSPASGG